MSKLDELIQKYCPNGVEHKALKNISRMQRGTSITKASSALGEYPVISGGKKPAFYCDTFNREGETVTVAGSGAGAGYVQFWNKRIFVNDAFTVKGIEGVSTKYLYYCLENMQEAIYATKKGSGVPHVHIKNIENFMIPVPPLTVQEKIVRILDIFAQYTTELTIELTAELEARKQQFEYYREKLICRTTKTVKLSEICNIYLGLTATPNYVESGVKFISAQNTSSDYLDLENTKFISEEDYIKATSNAKPKQGDILFTRVGSNIGHPVIIETDEKLCIFVSLGFLRIKDSEIVDNRYIKHWMNSDLFWTQVRKNVHGAAKVNLNTGWLKEFEIPLPDIDTQKKISDKLDLLDRICTDFSSDLPAEVAARQKQYEYYRDKLLTFQPLA